MPWLLIAVLAAHVLAAVFWAGSTFTMARLGASGAERLFRSQMGAATVSVATGAYLWLKLHEGAHSHTEMVLGVAAAAAVLAGPLQAAGGGPAIRTLAQGAGDQAALRARLAVVNRLAAALLGVTIVGMAIARYVA
ncbi:MAG TPA: hypothetical protein VFH92_08705 [Phenylobacterium sp.]|nr:hypothetical protein [Phenylobacterium sp.]